MHEGKGNVKKLLAYIFTVAKFNVPLYWYRFIVWLPKNLYDEGDPHKFEENNVD